MVNRRSHWYTLSGYNRELEPVATNAPATPAVYRTPPIPGTSRPKDDTSTGASSDVDRMKSDRPDKSAKRVERPQGGPKGERSE